MEFDVIDMATLFLTRSDICREINWFSTKITKQSKYKGVLSFGFEN